MEMENEQKHLGHVQFVPMKLVWLQGDHTENHRTQIGMGTWVGHGTDYEC
jgi:hypothetical protein